MISYEERKCVCCEKVYVNTLLMESEREHQFIICPNCARTVYRFYKSLRKEIDND